MIVLIESHTEEYDNRPRCVFFENGGASANISILGDEPDTAYLYDMISKNRRHGEASVLVREIDEYCVANKITLIIYAIVYDIGDDGIKTNEELKCWYEKNGAHFIGTTGKYNDPMLLLGYDSDQGDHKHV